jgi:hypothetical protein
MSPTWQETLIITSGMVRRVYGESVVTNSQPIAVAVHPAFNSAAVDTIAARRATAVLIRPTANVHFAIDAVPNTIGPHTALLAAATNYQFPLHPACQTLYFLDPVSGTGPVYITWLVGR